MNVLNETTACHPKSRDSVEEGRMSAGDEEREVPGPLARSIWCSLELL